MMFLPLLTAGNFEKPSDTKEQLAVTPTKVVVKFDGQERKFISYKSFIGDAITEGRIPFEPGDSTLPWPEEPITKDLVIEVLRAKPVTVYDEGKIIRGKSGYFDKHQILRQLKVEVLDEDIIEEDLYSSRFLENLHLGRLLVIKRAPIIYLNADGNIIKYSSWSGNVKDFLEKKGIKLEGKDYTSPPLETPLVNGMKIRLFRVREFKEVKTVTTKYIKIESHKNKVVSSTNCKIKTVQKGQSGIVDNTYRVRVEDGVEVWRKVVKTVVHKVLKNLIIIKDRFISPSVATGEANWAYYSGYTTAYRGWGGWPNYIGKKILVSNPKNGRQLVVEVIDYGPQQSTGDILDLSIPAYTYLGGSLFQGEIKGLRVQKVLCEA